MWNNEKPQCYLGSMTNSQKWPQWPWPLTYDLEQRTCTTGTLDTYVDQIWTKSVQPFGSECAPHKQTNKNHAEHEDLPKFRINHGHCDKVFEINDN